MKPRNARQKLSVLVAAVNDATPRSKSNPSSPSTPSHSTNNSSPATPEDRVVGFVFEQMEGVAAGLGKKETFSVSTRSARHIKKTINTMVNDAAVGMLKRAITNMTGGEKMGDLTDLEMESPKQQQQQSAGAAAVVTPARRSLTNTTTGGNSTVLTAFVSWSRVSCCLLGKKRTAT